MTQSSRYEFSICICNRNMAETLRISLESILTQVDKRFEVIVIDDGSNDKSLEILSEIKTEYSNFSFYSLKEDKKRKLGLTRNISIERASGDWVILHLDADDFIGNGIVEFVESVLAIHAVDSLPALYSGHQIHMAQRGWLLSIGPYRNLYRLEDRDLYQRLIPTKQWRIINHEKFITRLERSRNDSLRKTLRDSFEHLVSDTRYENNYLNALTKEITRRLPGKKLLKAFRLASLPLAYKQGRKLGIVSKSLGDFSDQGVRIYREQNTRTTIGWITYLTTQK
jgi:glycosyltransferase involved in cell wall biosynthesis